MSQYTTEQLGNQTWDTLGSCLVQIPNEHRRIHEGVFYSLSRHVALNDTQTDEVTLTTPALTAGYVHLLLALRGSLEVSLALYEAPTVSAAGTSLTPVNRHRSSSNAAAAVLKHTPTVTDPGTLLFEMRVGGFKQGGDDRGNEEWLLKPATTYYFLITSHANSNAVALYLDWYEA